MSGKAMLDRFIDKNPLAVMTRCIVGAIVGDQFDELFEENRSRQYDSTIKFSTLAMSIAEIALGTVENRNQAYLKFQKELKASKEAYYGKVNRCELPISEAVVRYSFGQASRLIEQLSFQEWEVLPGYRCFTIDGNHLQKTEKRLKETRGLCAAPLPGTIVARFDHQTRLFDQAYLLEDGHAQEASILDRVLEDLEAQSLLIADRHFCIRKFMLDIAARSGFFLIRQNARLQGKLLGKCRRIGRTDSGEVFEQKMEISDGDRMLVVRRITVRLNEATRDGDMELHLLSNVPAADADACTLADIYRQRWEIENAFYILTMTFNCEMASNCYPQAALFQFCMAMVAYNCRQVLLAALYAEHDRESVDQMSQYQMALEIVRPMEGMLTAIDEEEWESLTPRSTQRIAEFLRRVSLHVDIKSYRKTVRGPKKPKPPRKRCKAGTHVSTAKLLEMRK
jgi:Transposase DDE domain